MIGVDLYDFQQKAVEKLLFYTENIAAKKIITVKSPTGSGKTIMMLDYIDEYLESAPETAFVWLCPGKGALEEQSRQKMLKYAPDRKAQTLDDALTAGFSAESTTFINWEKITKKDNNAIKDSEKQNLFDQINRAKRGGVEFIIIIDEEHSNKTAKAQDIIDAFGARKIVRVSATTHEASNSEFIEIDENDVIATGLISRAIYINEGIEDDPEVGEGADILLNRANAMRKNIIAEYAKLDKNINPLVLVQFPNGKPETVEEVEEMLAGMGFTYGNHTVAKWLSDDKSGLDDSITDIDSSVCFLLMKQAISTGWDCPRAKILVKLREGMSEQFTIQTIGRIRRMPERVHYDNDILDCCYVYTFDQEYREGLLSDMERAYEKRILHLKDKCKTFTLTRETRDLDYAGLGEREVLERIYNYFVATYNLSDDYALNMQKMADGDIFIFGDHIYGKWLKGRFTTISGITEAQMETTSQKVDTHRHGIMMLHNTNELKTILGLQQYQVRSILERLFFAGQNSKYKLLKLARDEFYAFVINNIHQLKLDCKAVASEISNVQSRLKLDVKEQEFKIPVDDYFNYDPQVKKEIEYLSNAYEHYTSGFATPKIRSKTEVMLEKWCERRRDIDWVYKNGDTGQNYLSMVYLTATGKQYLFYPDYIIRKQDGSVWIIEAKGGESSDGESENIDDQAGNKFNILKNYAERHKLNWGFVRNFQDDLWLNNTEWAEEMNDPHWVDLDGNF